MYTQCPECRTVYEVAPADLAVAAGMVRCGECSQTFSALKSLAETPLEFETRDAPSATAEPVAAAESAGPAAAAGDHEKDRPAGNKGKPNAFAAVVTAALATQSHGSRDDGAVGPGDSDEDDRGEGAGSDETATLAEDDDVDADDDDDRGQGAASDETATLAEDDDVDADDDDDDRNQHASGDAAATIAADIAFGTAAAALRDRADEEDGGDEIVLDEFYEPAGSDDDEPIDDDEDWDELAPEPADESALFALPVPELHATGIVATAAVPEKLEGGAAAIDPFAQDATESGHPLDSGPGRPAIEPSTQTAMRANDAVDADDARDLSDYLRAPRPGRFAAAGWIGGSVLLALALVLQIVHQHRGDLVVHPRFGAAVTSLYNTVGLQVRPNWRVDDYKIVGQARLIEMPAEDANEQAPGALRFVAIIANRADRPQPPPMVRVTLRDRWGDPTGVRDFAPPEYLTDRSMVEQLLEPGQRLRVVLNLRDPGVEVEGFDFDMCLPDSRGKLRCSTEPAG